MCAWNIKKTVARDARVKKGGAFERQSIIVYANYQRRPSFGWFRKLFTSHLRIARLVQKKLNDKRTLEGKLDHARDEFARKNNREPRPSPNSIRFCASHLINLNADRFHKNLFAAQRNTMNSFVQVITETRNNGIGFGQIDDHLLPPCVASGRRDGAFLFPFHALVIGTETNPFRAQGDKA